MSDYDVELTDVRPGEHLAWDRLAGYLRQQLPELSGSLRVLQFPHGSANLTYLVTMGETKLVVRRPPFGVLAPGAHDMRREHRAMAGLAPVFDRVPSPLVFCDDPDIIGAPFLVTEYRDGVVVWDHVPPSMEHHERVGRRIGIAVVDALAELHLIDPTSVGLERHGRPDGYLARQVDGWQMRWHLVDTGRVPAMGAVGTRLARSMPDGRAPVSIVHNDYKLDNCQFDPADPDRVTSIFDWDMSTIGDPLADLGTLLNYWPDPDDRDGDRPFHVDGLEHVGLPSRSAVVERYASLTSFDVHAISWYEAFATWRTAVILEQLYQRWVRGESSDPRMGERGAPVERLARRAATLLGALEAERR